MQALLNTLDDMQIALQSEDYHKVGQLSFFAYDHTGVDLAGVYLAKAKACAAKNDMQGAAEAVLAVLAVVNSLGAESKRYKTSLPNQP
ncbi:hypothetical protein C5C56_16825 [Rathayibacter sp. AY1D1]|nr:hypothetical protein C5C56_16825 [Rathayibacter sp. AY1D1]